ncbi:MAG: hypothetical protein R3F50_18735 [Gammaproteobacteria bacterium]
MSSFFQELRRRKVFRVAAVYAVVSWVIIQVADTLFPALQLPEWTITFITVLLILGFFPTMVMAWAYQRSAEGIKPHEQVQASPGSPATSAQPINYLILIVVLAVAGFQVFDRFAESNLEAARESTSVTATDATLAPMRYNLNLGPLVRRPMNAGNFISRFEFSPDGEELIFPSFDGKKYQLNARNMEQFEARVLIETDEEIDGARFSPDGRMLAIHQGIGDLSILSLAGGSPQEGPENVQVNGYNWLDNNHIIYQDYVSDSVYRYALDTQDSELLFDGLKLPYLQSPLLVPGTDIILFTANRDNSSANPGDPALMSIDLQTGARRQLLANAYDARLIDSGQLLFMRGNDLWGVYFDQESLQVVGTPVPLVSGIENESSMDFGSYAVSSRGMLVYVPGTNVTSRSQRSLVWRDQNGNEEVIDLSPGPYTEMALSPSGQRIALSVSVDGVEDIWTYDFNLQGVLNRVTGSGDAENPVWSLDGDSLFFNRSTQDPDTNGVWQVSASGAGETIRVIPGDSLLIPRSLDPDGNLIIQRGLQGDSDIMRSTPASGNVTLSPLIVSEYGETLPSISPDGRLVAYVSFETGVREVFVRPYPDTESNRWRVSTNGGDEPHWGSNNRLYYLTTSRPLELVTLDIEYDTDLRVRDRRQEALRYYFIGSRPSYAVDEINDRLLFSKFIDQDERQSWGDGQKPVIANVISNFTAEVNDKVGKGESGSLDRL